MELSRTIDVIKQVREIRTNLSAQRSILVAITGIDGCGKGYLTAQIAEVLTAKGVNVAIIGIDGWLNLPEKRFNNQNPAEHFYLHALRFDEMFTQLIFPLRDRRSIQLVADFAEETATTFRQHTYKFAEIDVILLEGIYLLKRDFQNYYDLSVWINCTFETALERAIDRAQEGLPPEETIEAYRNIYFPAQQIHFERDAPQSKATLILNNDPRLTSSA
ncbi:uridine kinase [Aerosakkonemataceae cyanobacterium BLCC-F50]|uniref:Uridine kinase n=1 Tax=Floridaenema flaviceps BLCC-F50 TaxID=3153642 RepID=A0ABV4Y1T3_9CYAN